MNLKAYAGDLFLSGFNCAQAVAGAFADTMNADENTLFRAAAGFGAGIGRLQHTCGAVSGALIVIGLRFGRGSEDDPIDMKETTYDKAKEFVTRFEKRMGSILCLDLVDGIRTGTPEGRAEFIEKKYHEKVCAPAVVSAIEILEEILAESGQ